MVPISRLAPSDDATRSALVEAIAEATVREIQREAEDGHLDLAELEAATAGFLLIETEAMP